MPIEFVPFENRMLADAASLLADRHGRHRASFPELPARFEDGDITGIELAEGQIRLIKWTNRGDEFVRIYLEETPLSEVFFFLDS